MPYGSLDVARHNIFAQPCKVKTLLFGSNTNSPRVAHPSTMSDNLKNSEDDGANAASDDDTRIPMADEILDDEEELATTEEESNAAANTGGGPDRYLARSLRTFKRDLTIATT